MLISKLTKLKSEADTKRIGKFIAKDIKVGDILLLTGPLGVGKSALARSIIRALLDDETAEVPSPTYTLVQPYFIADDMALFHADLYRISDPDEVEELALFDNPENTILIVEWPEKAEIDWPSNALHINLSSTDSDSRRIQLSTKSERWSAAFDRIFK